MKRVEALARQLGAVPWSEFVDKVACSVSPQSRLIMCLRGTLRT